MSSPALPVARSVSPARVAVVTAGLIGGGAAAGALAGALGATLWIAITAGIGPALDPEVWLAAGVFGAPFGAALLPLAGFTALRRVPLGRLLITTILATAVGGAVGVMIFPMGWIVGAVTGFVVATGWLWAREKFRGRVDG
jgi:hypothetical protein